LQVLYLGWRGQGEVPGLWIAMHGDFRRARGISKAVSQTALKHGGTACQNIGKRLYPLEDVAGNAPAPGVQWARDEARQTGHVRVTAGISEKRPQEKKPAEQAYGHGQSQRVTRARYAGIGDWRAQGVMANAGGVFGGLFLDGHATVTSA
jgi:hypothetical protein